MRIIDLTMQIDERTPVFPGDPKQEITQFATIKEQGWNEKRLLFNSHFSTHIDAPSHMIGHGKTLSDFPIETFVGDAIVIDARNQQHIVSHLDNVKAHDIVLFCTRHSDKAYSNSYFTNNPTLTQETAQRLIDKKVKIVGIDSFTPDNEPYPIHKMLLKHNILIVENIINLKRIDWKKRFQCIILPLKIKNGDGAPCRVIAMQD